MNSAPRGPIFDDATAEAPDYTDGYERNMAAWRQAAEEEANRTARLSDELPRIQTYVDWIEGRHWAGGRARYKSKFYTNRVGKARIDSLAMLTDSRPTVQVYSKVEQWNPKAEMVDGVLRAEWMNNSMDLSLITAVDIAGVTGTSFWKVGAARPGMMRVIPCGPDMVKPIQPGFHIQQSTAVLYETYKSLSEVIARFPFRAQDIEREAVHHFNQTNGSMYARPDHIDNFTWNAIAPQMQRLIGKRVQVEDHHDPGLFRSVKWQEYYIDDLSRNESGRTITMRDPYLPLKDHNWWYEVKPGERLYPRKRLVIFAGRKIIYDGPSPYWHGLYPFACLRLNPVFWSFWGLSKYRDMLPVNSAINEIVAGVMDLVKRALEPTVVAKGTSITPAAWKEFFAGAPGQKLYLTSANANPASDIRYIDPPMLPQYVFEILAQFLGPEFDKLSGNIDIAALGKKLQVPGGDTLEQMRDSAQTSTRLEGRYVESFLRDAGLQGVSNVFQFYDVKQRMRLLGPDGVSVEDFMYDPQDMIPQDSDKFNFWKNFPITVVPGSLHGGAKDRTKMMLMGLRKMGDVSRNYLLRKLDVNEVGTINSELAEEREQMAQAAAIAKGGGTSELGGGAPFRMTRGQRNGEAF